MKSLQDISKLCDLAPRVELARIANTQRIRSASNYLGRAMYSDEDAERLIQAYWHRRRTSVSERGRLTDTTLDW